MSWYTDQLAIYNALPTEKAKKDFLKQHPDFAKRLQQGAPEPSKPAPFDPGASGLGQQAIAASVANQQQKNNVNPDTVVPTPQQPGQGGTGTPGAPGKDPNDPCPPGYRLDKTLGVCVLEITGGEDDPCPPGWHLDTATGRCVQDTEDDDTTGDNDLFAEFQRTLEEFGLTGMDDLLRDAVANGWNSDKFLLEMRRHPGYLANPLFAANVARSQQGYRFMSEGEVLSWADNAKRLARQYGYNEPSDAYLAGGIATGLSLAEIEHRFNIQDRINLFGAGVKMAAQEMGFEVGDSDLFEIFDPEKDTKEWEDMFRRAQMMGRPLTLGLGIRSMEEVRALEMLGVTPDEAFARYQSVAQGASRFERLGTIEEAIRKGLPDNFGSDLSAAAPNSLLIRAEVFQDPAARAELQQMFMREIARFKTGGGAVTAGTGQQVGLLTSEERQSYG